MTPRLTSLLTGPAAVLAALLWPMAAPVAAEETVIAGLRPGVVSSLVQLDAATDEVDAAMNLDDAFERIEALVAGDGDEVEE